MSLAMKTVENQRMMAASFTDATSQKTIGMCEFSDTDFSNLESLIIQQNIRECLVSDDQDCEKINRILNYSNVIKTVVPKGKVN